MLMCEECIRENKRGIIDEEDIDPAIAIVYVSGYDHNGRPGHGNLCSDHRSKLDIMNWTIISETSLI